MRYKLLKIPYLTIKTNIQEPSLKQMDNFIVLMDYLIIQDLLHYL